MKPSYLSRILIVCGLTTSLAGCTNTMNAAVASLTEVVSPQAKIQDLNPAYHYLYLTTPHQQATLVLGYRQAIAQQTREIWYSADRTTLQLEEGRYHSSKNLLINWQETKLHSAPALENVNRTQTYVRERLQMPGYMGPYQETVAVGPVEQTDLPREAPEHFKKNSEWLKEFVLYPDIPITQTIVAYYARDPQTKKIVWAMQCLSENYCLQWQHAPLQ